MAGSSVTFTENQGPGLQKVKAAWTSDDTTGAVSDTTTYAYNGKVERFITDPDGTAAPTDDYDITITDEDGYDVLHGAGADRDTANTEQVLASSLGMVYKSTLTLNVTNAGNSKQGVVYLYIR